LDVWFIVSYGLHTLSGFLQVFLQRRISSSLLLSVFFGLLVQFTIFIEFMSSMHIRFLRTLISALIMTTSNLRSLQAIYQIPRSIDFMSFQSVGSFDGAKWQSESQELQEYQHL
jgi:hypothetical protein